MTDKEITIEDVCAEELRRQTDKDSMSGIIYVIAGNYEQYNCFLKLHKLSAKEYVYACRPEHIKRGRGRGYILTGESWNNPLFNSYRGQDLLEAFGLKEITTIKAAQPV